MINKEFRSLLNSLSQEEMVELHIMDPYFLYTFCYMLTLEIQLEKQNSFS
jgi:hypothetical protein